MTTADESDLGDIAQLQDDADLDSLGLPLLRERKNDGREMKMAPARFFAEQDRQDTGLESMFQNAFRLGDTPKSKKPPGDVHDQDLALPAGERNSNGSFQIPSNAEEQQGDLKVEERGRWMDLLGFIIVSAICLFVAFALVKSLG